MSEKRRELLTFSENSKRIRLLLGLSQEDVASRVCVHKKTYARWEQAKIKPHDVMRGYVAIALNVSVALLERNIEHTRFFVERNVELSDILSLGTCPVYLNKEKAEKNELGLARELFAQGYDLSDVIGRVPDGDRLCENPQESQICYWVNEKQSLLQTLQKYQQHKD